MVITGLVVNSYTSIGIQWLFIVVHTGLQGIEEVIGDTNGSTL